MELQVEKQSDDIFSRFDNTIHDRVTDECTYIWRRWYRAMQSVARQSVSHGTYHTSRCITVAFMVSTSHHGHCQRYDLV